MSFLYLAISSLDEPLNQADSCALWLRQAPSHSFSGIATPVLQEKMSLAAKTAKLESVSMGLLVAILPTVKTAWLSLKPANRDEQERESLSGITLSSGSSHS